MSSRALSKITPCIEWYLHPVVMLCALCDSICLYLESAILIEMRHYSHRRRQSFQAGGGGGKRKTGPTYPLSKSENSSDLVQYVLGGAQIHNKKINE